MFALKENVDVEFEVKIEENPSPKKKTRPLGAGGRANKSALVSSGAAPKDSANSSRVEVSKGVPETEFSSKRGVKIEKNAA